MKCDFCGKEFEMGNRVDEIKNEIEADKAESEGFIRQGDGILTTTTNY